MKKKIYYLNKYMGLNLIAYCYSLKNFGIIYSNKNYQSQYNISNYFNR